jgi:multidrug transporter EmrE-like cation transporter
MPAFRDIGKIDLMGYLYVLATIALGAYGQVVLKWQIDKSGTVPSSLSGQLDFFGRLLVNPWVLSALAGAFIAALAWFAALSHLELSRAYPVLGLSFALILLLSALFFSEPLTLAKVAGVTLIIGGVIVATQG